MAQMSSSAAVERFQAESRHALERVQHYRLRGDQAQVERWHQAWSLAEEASSAERLEQGGGARLLRRKTPPPLRPLPDETAPMALPPALPPVPEHAEQVALTNLSTPTEDPLSQALARHGRIEQALRSGVNPFPNELVEEEWQYHLTAFRVDGPFDCELLQAAEAAVEAIVECRPEFWEGDPEAAPEQEEGSAVVPFEHAALTERLRSIYQESLSELTEGELRADLETCLTGRRGDTALLIEAELMRREPEVAPDLGGIKPPGCPKREQAGSSPPKANSAQPLSPLAASDRRAGEHSAGSSTTVAEVVAGNSEMDTLARTVKSTRPRRRRPLYSTEPLPPSSAVSTKEPRSPSVEPQPDATGYTTAPAWIDAAGRTRTWSLFNPAGEKLAEITTRRDAEKLAALLNGSFSGAPVITSDSARLNPG